MTSHINSETYLQTILQNYIKCNDLQSIININDFLIVNDPIILEIALLSKNIDIIKYFLYKGYAIPHNVDNISILHYLIQHKLDNIFMDFCFSINNIKEFINYTEKYEENSLNVLSLAILHNYDTSIIKYIIENTDNLNYIDLNGDTAFILAAKFMRKEILNILLNYDIDININNKLCHNALFYLFKNIDIESINLLIQKGGKFIIDDVINLNNFKSNKAIFFDIIKDNIYSWIIEDNTMILKICIDNKYYNLLYFFGKRININNIIIAEKPILFYILDNYKEKSFKIFIDILNRLNYNYNKKDIYNNNLLHYIFQNNPKLIFILEKYIPLHEISINHCNDNNETPLIYLFRLNIQTKEIYEKLLQIYKDIDIFIKDKYNYTFIDYLLINIQSEKIEEESKIYNINIPNYLNNKNPVFILHLANKYNSVYKYINTLFDFNIIILKNLKFIYEPINCLIIDMFEDKIINNETIKVLSYLIDYKKDLPEDFIKYLLQNNCITIINKFEIIENYIKNHFNIQFLLNDNIYSEYLYYNKITLLHYIVSIDLHEDLMLHYISQIYNSDNKIKEHINITNKLEYTPIQVLLKNYHYISINQIFKVLELFIISGAFLDLQIDSVLNIKIPSYLISHKNLIKYIPKNIITAILIYLDNDEYIEVCKEYENIFSVLDKICEINQINDNCYICYSNDTNDYYYECKNKHKYHHKCLLEYYNNVNIDINCFYCKEKYNFKKVYKHLSNKEQ